MNVKFVSLVLLGVSLGACAHPPVSQPVSLVSTDSVVALPPPREGLTAQIMYQFLLGEIAGQRGELKLSAEAYSDLAVRTRDARVARRATEISLYARQPQRALQNARLWQELEPTSPKALQTLSSLLIGAGRLTEAKGYLAAWIKSGQGSEIFMQLHGLLARQKDRQAVADLVSDLAAAYPAQPEARFAVAQAAWQAGQGQQAVAALDDALRLKPDWDSAALLKAEVLHQKESEQAALAYLAEFLGAHPDAREVRLVYAKQLARAGRYAESRAAFEYLAKEVPSNPDTYFALGLLALQSNDLDNAQSSFTKALDLGYADQGSARYYLGQLTEAKNRLEEALTWYQSVDGGQHELAASLRAAVVMGKLGRVDEARAALGKIKPDNEGERIQVVQTEAQILREAKNFTAVFDVLSKALEASPDSLELRYDRAMVGEKLNRLDILEQDLRHIIKLKPDYAHAYNALGYTLADRTERIKEAIALLDQALKLSPDDPFIQDSMGWALFKAKRLAESVDYLRRAFSAKPDPEIAAHLGEALWAKGERDEARRIWQGSLQSHPDNETLREVVTRLTP